MRTHIPPAWAVEREWRAEAQRENAGYDQLTGTGGTCGDLCPAGEHPEGVGGWVLCENTAGHRGRHSCGGTTWLNLADADSDPEEEDPLEPVFRTFEIFQEDR